VSARSSERFILGAWLQSAVAGARARARAPESGA